MLPVTNTATATRILECGDKQHILFALYRPGRLNRRHEWLQGPLLPFCALGGMLLLIGIRRHIQLLPDGRMMTALQGNPAKQSVHTHLSQTAGVQ